MHTSRKSRPRCSRKQVLETSPTKHVVWQLARSVIRLHLTSTRPPSSPVLLLLLLFFLLLISIIISARSSSPTSPAPRDLHAPMQLNLIATLQRAARKQPVFIVHLCSWTRAVDLGDGARPKPSRDRFEPKELRSLISSLLPQRLR